MDHAARRARLVERLPELGIESFLVTSLPNVRFLTGFTGSNGQLLVPAAGDAVFFTDGRYTEQSSHQVPDIERITYGADFLKRLAETSVKLGDGGKVGFEAAHVTYKSFTDLGGAGLDLTPTTDEVERLRWIKDPEEIGYLQAAQDVADRVFDLIVKQLAEEVTEKEIAFEMDTAMRREGAEAISFETIVAFGPNAAEPHHEPTDRPLSRGDVVKLDFGSVVDGYHSDMTRTVAFGDPGAQLREIYEVVRRSQQAGVDAVRAGAVGGEVDRVSREVIDEAGYGSNYTHSLGHGVGLEVHEGPTLRANGTDILPVGTVVTVEPGIYVAGVGGVRIEDMVEVLESGCRVMPGTIKELVVL